MRPPSPRLLRNLPLAVLLIDLDRFKEINDTFGHPFGDLVLQRLNPRLRAGLRSGDLVARLGGDEFAVLLADADRSVALRVAQRIQGEMNQMIEIDGHRIDIGASIGIALFPEHGPDAHTLLQRADVAMYAAKRAHEGYTVYTPEPRSDNAHRLMLTADLRRAIEDSQLCMHFQPKVDLKSGQVRGAEALVRWRHPTEGQIAPSCSFRWPSPPD